jgi:hypothetical protein
MLEMKFLILILSAMTLPHEKLFSLHDDSLCMTIPYEKTVPFAWQFSQLSISLHDKTTY